MGVEKVEPLRVARPSLLLTADGDEAEVVDRLKRLAVVEAYLRWRLEARSMLTLRRLHDHKGELTVCFVGSRYDVGDWEAVDRVIGEAWEAVNEYVWYVHYQSAGID